MAEKQAEHRMALESQVVRADVRRQDAGLAAGFIVALAGLAAAYFMVDRGNEAAGIAIGAIDLAALVGSFTMELSAGAANAGAACSLYPRTPSLSCA